MSKMMMIITICLTKTASLLRHHISRMKSYKASPVRDASWYDCERRQVRMQMRHKRFQMQTAPTLMLRCQYKEPNRNSDSHIDLYNAFSSSAIHQQLTKTKNRPCCVTDFTNLSFVLQCLKSTTCITFLIASIFSRWKKNFKIMHQI